MLKRSLFLIALSLPMLAKAEGENVLDDGCCPLIPHEPVESCQLAVGYLYPALYNLQNCCVNFSIAGEFIYWEVNFDGLPQIATKVDLTGLTTLTLLSPDRKFQPGFKIAAGFGLPQYDDWIAEFEYTWLYRTVTNHFNTSGPPGSEIINSNFLWFNVLLASSLKSVSKFNLNFFNAVLGRPFYLSKRLIVRPMVGLKSWWATQKEDLTFNVTLIPNVAPQTSMTKSTVWGIGPYISANVQALLWCGTYVLGKAAVWNVYTRLSKYRCLTNYPIGGRVTDEKIHSQPFNTQIMYEIGVALGWGSYFCNCSYHIDLSVGYDMMSNYERMLTAAQGFPVREFYYQGLSVKAQFDF